MHGTPNNSIARQAYRMDPSTFSNQLIGYWKGPTRQMLVGVGDPFADWKDVVYVGSLEDENGTGGIMSGIQVLVCSCSSPQVSYTDVLSLHSPC